MRRINVCPLHGWPGAGQGYALKEQRGNEHRNENELLNPVHKKNSVLL